MSESVATAFAYAPTAYVGLGLVFAGTLVGRVKARSTVGLTVGLKACPDTTLEVFRSRPESIPFPG